MKNKKLVSAMLTAVMTLGMTAGTAVPAMADDTFNLKMQIVTFGQEFSGLADVENAINAVTEPEIGVTVTLDPIAAWDLPSTSALAITSNEEIDLMCILPLGSNMDSVSNYSSKNMLLPLDDLYAEYGTDIDSCIGDLIKLGYVGETLYAVPANYYAGHGSSFVVLTSLLDELGFSFDEEQIYTLEDIEEVMAAYSEAKGAGYYAIAGFADGDAIPVICPTDDGRIIVDYADGVDRMTSPYGGQVPIYGDELRTPKYVPVDAEMFDKIMNYNDTLVYSKAFGYSFDSSNLAPQISAINNVLQTYRAQLSWGTVDVDSVLPQFISELEAAGLNDVIAANQEQLDAWLAQQ